MGDQTMRQGTASPQITPATKSRVLFRVIDPIKSVDGGGELRGCHLTDRSTTLRSLLGRIRVINRKALTSGHICM